MRILFYMPVVYGSIEDRIAWVKNKKMRGELIYNIVDTEKLAHPINPVGRTHGC